MQTYTCKCGYTADVRTGSTFDGAFVCDNCLADEAQALLKSGTYECLEPWLRRKYYNFRQGLVSLGRIMRDPVKLDATLNRADAWYTTPRSKAGNHE